MAKARVTADLLPVLTEARKDISTMMYVEDQDCVIVFMRNGAMMRIPTPGSELDLIKAVVNAL